MDLLQFSHPHKHTGYHCKVSPDCNYVGNAIDDRLVIRSHSNELLIMHVFENSEPIEWVGWSPDSQYIATANFKKAQIRVWSVTDTQWHSEIADTSFGLTRVCWSPDSSRIISCSELRLTVWNLLDKSMEIISSPKLSSAGSDPKGIEYSPNGKYVAIMDRYQAKDHIGIYSARLRRLEHFQTETSDIENMRWSPSSDFLAVWDNCLYYKLLIYKPNGDLVSKYSAYEHGLGIKSVTWSPGGELLAVGSFDGKVRLLNTSNWSEVDSLSHPEIIDQRHLTVIYEEYTLPKSNVPTLDTCVAYRPITRRPYRIPILRPDNNTPHPKVGISMCQFSGDGKYFLSRNDSMPHTLWIWDILSLTCCAIIQQLQPIKQVYWCPQLPHMLVMSGGNENLYVIHQDEDADFVVVPCRPASDFNLRKLTWSDNGTSLMLMDHHLYCLVQVKL